MMLKLDTSRKNWLFEIKFKKKRYIFTCRNNHVMLKLDTSERIDCSKLTLKKIYFFTCRNNHVIFSFRKNTHPKRIDCSKLSLKKKKDICSVVEIIT